MVFGSHKILEPNFFEEKELEIIYTDNLEIQTI